MESEESRLFKMLAVREAEYLLADPLQPNAEMVRLREMLDSEGIEWHDDSDQFICRTNSGDDREPVCDDGCRYTFSAVCGLGTYGTIELWRYCDTDGPIGLDTAEEAMAKIKEVVY